MYYLVYMEKEVSATITSQKKQTGTQIPTYFLPYALNELLHY